MKYKYIIALLFCSLLTSYQGFSQAKEITAKFRGGIYPAFSNQYDFPPDIVSDAIQKRLKTDGITARTRRGVISSEGIKYNILTPQTIDLYFQTKGTGRKGKDGTVVDLFISKGKDNFAGEQSDPELASNAIQYLNGLRHDITVYGLEQQIKSQKNIVDGLAKDYKKMLKDSRKLESRRYRLKSDRSTETNADKQSKITKKISKLDKAVDKKQSDIRDRQHDLDRQKDQLSLLQTQLENERQRGGEYQ